MAEGASEAGLAGSRSADARASVMHGEAEERSLKPGALILGGTHGSLAVARSLGRRGIPVWLTEERRGVAGVSRFVDRRLPWPAAGERADWLVALARREGLKGWVLFPAGDPEVRLVAEHRDELATLFRLTTQPWPVLARLQDKSQLYEHAAAIGLDIPVRYAQGAEMPVPGQFPVIIKPAMRETRNALTRAKAWRADNAEEFARLYGEAVHLMPPHEIVVQELIPGDGAAQFSYAGLWQNGKPVASLTARRLRQFPLEFGFTSTFVESIEAKPVEEAAERLLRSVNYHGLVEAEFKFDARDGKYKILDVNTRMWSWIGIGAIAGVDFPYLAWKLALGEAVPPVRGNPGFTWRHSSRDLIAGIQEMRAHHTGFGNYVASLRRPGTAASFAPDDWLPGVLDVPLTIGRMLGRLVQERE